LAFFRNPANQTWEILQLLRSKAAATAAARFFSNDLMKWK